MTCQVDARYVLSLKNAHRMLITGVLLSAKLMDDSIYNNSYWAKVSLSGALRRTEGFTPCKVVLCIHACHGVGSSCFEDICQDCI